jgi:hypothetical protein
MEHVIEIALSDAPFLVGVKGRNIALIRKWSGMHISINGTNVVLTRQKPTSNPDLATRMILSACNGGILRWFVTATATHEGYPFDRVHELQLLAQTHQCALKLLRARCGHMCLMLVPDDALMAPVQMAAARSELLAALAPTVVAAILS